MPDLKGLSSLPGISTKFGTWRKDTSLSKVGLDRICSAGNPMTHLMLLWSCSQAGSPSHKPNAKVRITCFKRKETDCTAGKLKQIQNSNQFFPAKITVRFWGPYFWHSYHNDLQQVFGNLCNGNGSEVGYHFSTEQKWSYLVLAVQFGGSVIWNHFEILGCYKWLGFIWLTFWASSPFKKTLCSGNNRLDWLKGICQNLHPRNLT